MRLRAVETESFRCKLCGFRSAALVDRCPTCHRHGTFSADGDAEGDEPAPEPIRFSDVKLGKKERLVPFHPAFDRLFNGGFRRGGTYLLSGQWGSGKSSLALQLVENAPGPVLYVCAEESAADVKERALRLGLKRTEHLELVESRTVEEALEFDCRVLVVDSIHGIRSEDADGPEGDPHQTAAVLRALVRHAKAEKTTVLMLAHHAKDGALKGTTEVPHAVTAVSELEKTGEGLRRWIVHKNRHGPTHDREAGRLIPRALTLEMTDRGLVLVDPVAEENENGDAKTNDR